MKNPRDLLLTFFLQFSSPVQSQHVLVYSLKSHSVGANRTAAQAAWHFPKAKLHAITEAGALAPIVAPQVKPAAE